MGLVGGSGEQLLDAATFPKGPTTKNTTNRQIDSGPFACFYGGTSALPLSRYEIETSSSVNRHDRASYCGRATIENSSRNHMMLIRVLHVCMTKDSQHAGAV